MTKKYAYVEPDGNMNPVETIMSEQDILDSYGPYWTEQLRKAGKQHLVSKERCIEDWIAVNYAYEVTDEAYKEKELKATVAGILLVLLLAFTFL